MSIKLEQLLDDAAESMPLTVHPVKDYRDRALSALLVHHSEQCLLNLEVVALRALNRAVAIAAEDGWNDKDLAEYAGTIPITFWILPDLYEEWRDHKLGKANLPSNVVTVQFGVPRQR